MTKIELYHCNKKIIVEEKDLKKGIFRKQGYEFEIENGNEKEYPPFFSFTKTYKIRYIFKTFRLQEDIKLKYVICPICGEKIWLNTPLSFETELTDYWIKEKGYNIIKINERRGKWEEEISTRNF